MRTGSTLTAAAAILLALALASAPEACALDAAKELGEATEIIRQGMAAMSLADKDILPRHDYIPSDAYRLALIDEYLKNPLAAAKDALSRFSPWLSTKEPLSASLLRAFKDLGEKDLAAAEVKPAADLAAAVAALGAAMTSGEAKPVDGKEHKSELETVPAAARPFLIRLLAAVAAAVRERQAAFSKISEEEWVQLRQYGSQFNTGVPPQVQMQFFTGIHARIDRRRIFSAALAVAAALDNLRAFRDDMAKVTGKPQFHVVIETPPGRVEFGGWGDDTYAEEALFILDFGGNDTYGNSAGGTLYTPAKTSILVDLAGDDAYENPEGLAQGSGMYGVGMLVDCAGRDKYKAGKVSQGSGHAGAGVLWDWSGDDTYTAAMMSQGTGFQGAGLLRDDEGVDEYSVGFCGQGFGTTQGMGVLQDLAGDDTYRAGGYQSDTARDKTHFISMAQGFGNGHRAESLDLCSSGGIGLLADASGSDTYVCDIFGQGCAYWYSIGALLDGSGDDLYLVYNYGQGAGIHMAAGLLMDFSGNDRYEGGYHALGHSLDRSVGWFLDFEGSDLYKSLSDSDSQGAAVKPLAVAFFVDFCGDDVYRNGIPGYVREPDEESKGLWPKAFFLDLGGKDRYFPARGDAKDGGTWKNNRYGYGVDR